MSDSNYELPYRHHFLIRNIESLLILVAAATGPLSSAQTAEDKKPPIIDIHFHTFGGIALAFLKLRLDIAPR